MKKLYILTTILSFTYLNLIAQTTDVVTEINSPQGIIVNGDDLYIAQPGDGKISKYNLTSGTQTATNVIVGITYPRQLLLIGNDLYIAETSIGTISKINITAGAPTTTDILTGLIYPQGMALNGNDLYFIEEGNSGASKISRINITDATPIVTEIVSGLNVAIQLSINGNDLYIAEKFGNKISKIDLTDAIPTVTDVVTVNRPNSIVSSGNEIYIAETGPGSGDNKITKFDVTSIVPTTTDVVTGLDNPTGIAIKDNILFISEVSLDKIISTEITLSINENLFTEKIRISPNPSSQFIQFSGLTKTVNYKVFNTLGSIVKNGTISNEDEIDIRNFTNGMYLLQFENGNTIKFIKN